MTRSRKSRRRGRRKPLPRQRIRNVKRAVRIGLPLIVAVLVGTVFYRDLKAYLEGAARYRVAQIEVTGTSRIPEEKIIAYSGVRRGDDSVFSIRPRRAAQLVSEHPRVKRAAVALTVPDGVSIEVVEREPVALVVFNKAYELDTEGVVLGECEKGVVPDGPIMSGVERPDPFDMGVQLTDDGLKEALELWRIFSSDAISSELKVSEIDIAERDSLIMFLKNKGYEIRWPRENLAHCVSKLKHLWEETGKFPKVRHYVDLRFDDTVPTR